MSPLLSLSVRLWREVLRVCASWDILAWRALRLLGTPAAAAAAGRGPSLGATSLLGARGEEEGHAR